MNAALPTTLPFYDADYKGCLLTRQQQVANVKIVNRQLFGRRVAKWAFTTVGILRLKMEPISHCNLKSSAFNYRKTHKKARKFPTKREIEMAVAVFL